MNQSGKPIKAFADLYHLSAEDILVVHDDLDLPVGRLKVVKSGGAGGHKGALSVIHHLGDNGFNRVKIGIGRPRYGESVEDYVLSPFYKDEKGVIGEVVKLGVQACELFVSKGVDFAMNHINSQNL
jgi:PTH1 family peptidyl-tRNA hydrolase